MKGWRRRRAISSNAPAAGPKRAMRRRRARRGTRSGTSDTGAVRVFPNPSPVADPDRRDMPLPFDRGFELIGERQQQGLPARAGRELDADGKTVVAEPHRQADRKSTRLNSRP